MQSGVRSVKPRRRVSRGEPQPEKRGVLARAYRMCPGCRLVIAPYEKGVVYEGIEYHSPNCALRTWTIETWLTERAH